MAEKQVDILIVGGGLIGAAISLALIDSGYSCLLVEAKPLTSDLNWDFDARSLALAPASIQILKMLDLWPLIEPHASPIEHIYVSEAGRFGKANLQGTPDEPLGYVVEMQYLQKAMYPRLPMAQVLAPAEVIGLDLVNSQVSVSYGGTELKINANLIIAADGADSLVRQLAGLAVEVKDYKQHALVANIGLSRAHQNKAYERFTSSGPMALLPMNDLRAALVWSLPESSIANLMTLSDEDFLAALQRVFGYRLGRFLKVGKRAVFPLRQMIMPQQIAWPLVFIGNAAHSLHPVAGQGFNLGLRDVALLAQCILEDGLTPAMLQTYQEKRRHDQTAIVKLTQSLVELFTSKWPGLALARTAGLVALDNAPFIKKILTRYASGYAGTIPDLVCGLPLLRNKHEC